MARRRMVSLDIIDTDKFVEMPSSSQCLYFHLLMRADDDGFVDSPKKILKMINCSDDDLKLLSMKQFIIPFENGICVIKDWRIHNYIQNDRYKETLYLKEKKQLSKDENGSYSVMDTECIHNGYTGKDSIELGNSKSKDSIELDYIPFQIPKIEDDFEKLWELYPKKNGKKDAFKHFKNSLSGLNKKKKTSYDVILNGLYKYLDYIKINNITNQYIKDGSTWFNKECWLDDYKIDKKIEKVPEWFNKNIEDNIATDEEIEEFERKLKRD